MEGYTGEEFSRSEATMRSSPSSELPHVRSPANPPSHLLVAAFGANGMAKSNPAIGEFTCLKCCWKLKREKADIDAIKEAGRRIEVEASALKERQRQDLVDRTEVAQMELESVRRAKRERWEREEVNREKYFKIIEDASKLLQAVDQETAEAAKIASAVLKKERAKRASLRARGKVRVSDPRKAFLKKLEGVCLALMKMNDSYFFRVPVDRKLYPNYYTFIEKPVDLSAIRSKVKGGHYQDTAQVRSERRGPGREERKTRTWARVAKGEEATNRCKYCAFSARSGEERSYGGVA